MRLKARHKPTSISYCNILSCTDASVTLLSSIVRIFHKIVIRILFDNIVEQVGIFFEGRYVGIIITTSPADIFRPFAVFILIDSGFATWTG
jgi:hypothetical protein